jgi:transcriptional regulator with XRE-family HTH domain
MNIADTIKSAIEQQFLDVSQVARRCKVSPSAVYHWMHGKNTPSEKYIHKLAAALKVPEDQLRVTPLVDIDIAATEKASTNSTSNIVHALPPHKIRRKRRQSNDAKSPQDIVTYHFRDDDTVHISFNAIISLRHAIAMMPTLTNLAMQLQNKLHDKDDDE